MPDFVYLTVDEVVAIHNAEVGETSVDLGGLDAAVHRPQQSAFGEDAYPGIHEKAAAFFHGIAATQYFMEGNKRTAVLAVIIFYGKNGYRFIADDAEVFHLALDVGKGELNDLGELARRLEGMVVAAPEDYE